MNEVSRTNTKKLVLAMLVASSLMLGSSTLAAEPTFTTIDFPGATSTSAFDINGDGDIVGLYTGGNNKTHGFLLSDGQFTPIDYPDANVTRTRGINSRGDMVGEYVDAGGKTHGYLLKDNVFTP